MKVSEIAKEFKIPSEWVLIKLRTLKLKAKDEDQDLSAAVGIVVRSALRQDLKEGKLKTSSVKPAGEMEQREKRKKEVKNLLQEARAPVKAKKAEPEKPIPPPEEEKSRAEKPKIEKSTVPKPEAVAEEKKVKKPKTVTLAPEEKAPVKAKAPSAPAPFVPLKPLAKRKKKPLGKTREESLDVAGAVKPAEEHREGVSAERGMVPQVTAQSDVSVGAGMNTPGVVAKDLRPLELKIPISVKDFASAIQDKTSNVLKKLMQMGILANINQNLGEDVVNKLAMEFGFNLVKVKTTEQQLIQGHLEEDENPELLAPRAPVVTLMGHVDHGKTSLLDRIRSSHITDQEHGGITQHIGAYSVNVPKGRITFLDTPGHEAFTSMRARGAHITDLVILVVAADEGIMPQTDEAIDHARAANVPIVVAMNKIDRPNADPERVKKQLSERGFLPEDWGGKTIVVGVSAVTGQGISELLEMLLLEAEMLELKANANKKASGIVVEAHLSRGKGAVASMIVQSGTLKLNDIIIAGPYYGKVKAMFDDLERPISEAGPSQPVELLGLPGVPDAGDMFYVVEDERQAKEITGLRQDVLKDEKLRSTRRITLEDLYNQIKEGQIKELNVILKADVQGSLEALKDSLEKIPSDEVKVKFIHAGVGEVNASDVILANASNAIIIAFHVGAGARAEEELAKNPVDVREYRIIYDAVNDMRKALEGMLEPKKKKKFLSRIEVRQVFKLSKSGIVAGCFVVKGKVTRKANVDVIRNGEVVFSGQLSSLKRFKDDVREVTEGFECGLTVQGFDQILAGDVIEAYEIETIARKL